MRKETKLGKPTTLKNKSKRNFPNSNVQPGWKHLASTVAWETAQP